MSEPMTSLWRIPSVTISADQIQTLTRRLDQRLQDIAAAHPVVRFSTSLAAEDLVLTDAIARAARGIQLFTLDTGRLHNETLAMVTTVEAHYGLTIERVSPDPQAVAHWVAEHGLNGFYEHEAARTSCCQVRKVIPLARALNRAQAWITGMRRDQSVTRAEAAEAAWDEERQLHKFNPLIDWRDDEVWAYLAHHRVPIHPLHHKGYPSIGCEPCTRAIRAHEDLRAGRWWWLHQTRKECGLHVH